MLDMCSTGSFVLEDIADSLGIKGADTRLTGNQPAASHMSGPGNAKYS